MRKAGSFLWFLVILGGIAALFFPRVSKYFELKRMEEKLTGDISSLKEKIKELEKEEYLIRNDVDHLERVMREELRLVKPGEIVYKIIPDETPGTKETKPPEPDAPPKP